MKVTTPTAFKAELLARPFAKFNVCLVQLDGDRETMQVFFADEDKPIGELNQYFDLERGEKLDSYECVAIGRLPELGNVTLMQVAAEIWPKAHLVWTACSCCCEYRNCRQAWPGKIAARQE